MQQGESVRDGGFTKGKIIALPCKAAIFTFMNEDLERKERSLLEEKLENETDCRISGCSAWLLCAS